MPATITREAWLAKAMPIMKKWLEDAGAKPFPDPQISIGFPSQRGLATGKRRVLAQCWDKSATESKKQSVIFISPIHLSAVEVVDSAVHELVHAAVGCIHGHKKPFKELAKAVGLVGPARSCGAGPELLVKIRALSKELGPFPHDPLVNFRTVIKRKRKGKNVYECKHCGKKVRIAGEFNAIHLCDDGKKAEFVLRPNDDEGEDESDD